MTQAYSEESICIMENLEILSGLREPVKKPFDDFTFNGILTHLN